MFSIDNDNYGPGPDPWNGTPKRVLPNAHYLTPGALLSAQTLNGILGAGLDTIAAFAGAPAQNWRNPNAQPSNGLTSFTQWLTAHWDPITNAWLLGANFTTAGFQLITTPGLGDEASGGYSFVPNTSTSYSGATVRTIENDGTRFYAAGINAGAASVVYMAESGSGGWTGAFSPSGSDFTDVKLRRFGLQTYLFLTSSANTAHTYVIETLDHGTTWGSAQAAGIFKGFTPLVADNGAIMVFMASGSLSASYVTGLGSSWTTRSLAFLAHSDSLVGLVYDPATNRFVLITTGSDSRLHTYTSGDGITWAEGGGFSLAPFASVTPFAACATATGCIACLLVDSSNVDHIVYSPDDGQNWYLSPATLLSGGSFESIHASPSGFCALNNNWLRFSHLLGNGAALT